MASLALSQFTKMDILFWFRKALVQPERPPGVSKNDQYGSIICRITVAGKRLEIGSTGVRCWKSQWRNGKLEPSKHASASLITDQLKISRQHAELQNIYARMITDSSAPVSAYAIKQAYIRTAQKGLPSQVSVTELVKEWLAYEAKRVAAKAITESSRKVCVRHLSHLTKYMEKGRRAAMPAEEFGENQIDDFRLSLLTGKTPLLDSYVYKILQTVKKCFAWGKKRKIISLNPVIDYSIPGDSLEPDTTHLTREQLLQLVSFDPYKLADVSIASVTALALDKERDALVFSCLTGMHDADYKARDYQVEQRKNGVWLKGVRKKTGTRFELPLDPIGVAIIKKYGGVKGLPALTNVRRNIRLKQLGTLAGVPVILTTKIGRKTFTDRMLNELGYDPLDVASMLGHKDLKNLKHYARVKPERILSRFVHLKGEEGSGEEE
jgi:integrase